MSDGKSVKPSSIDGALIKKILSVVLFAAIGYVAFLGIIVLSVCQLFFYSFSGNSNKSLLNLSRGLCDYLSAAINYISLLSDKKPYPG